MDRNWFGWTLLLRTSFVHAASGTPPIRIKGLPPAVMTSPILGPLGGGDVLDPPFRAVITAALNASSRSASVGGRSVCSSSKVSPRSGWVGSGTVGSSSLLVAVLWLDETLASSSLGGGASSMLSTSARRSSKSRSCWSAMVDGWLVMCWLG